MATDKPRILLTVSDELLEQIDEYWHEKRIRSRSEALRRLLEEALKNSKKTPKK
jgi:metal-responsive CopG/Arc/MetJ family transcriptional regulator